MDRNLEYFLTSHIDFLFVFGQSGDNCKRNLFLKRKVRVTERPRPLNPIKAIGMFICPIIGLLGGTILSILTFQPWLETMEAFHVNSCK